MLFIFFSITILVYVARMWARFTISKNLGLDDFLISVAMLPLIGLTISTVLGIRVYGYQWHVWDQTARSLVATRKIALSIELNYVASTVFTKVSLLCFYRRISERLTNQFVHWVFGMIVFCSIYGIIIFFIILWTCTPIEGFWRYFDIAWRLQHKLECRDEGALIVACAAISSVQDLIICLLPVLLIWNLQISKRQKFGLCGIFGLGLITFICGLMRTFYATKLYYFSYDTSWIAYDGWVWTTLEAHLAVICASAPSLKVFFSRYFSQRTSPTAYSISDSRGKTPDIKSTSQASPKTVQASVQRLHIRRGGRGDPPEDDIAMDGIHVDYKLHVRYESDAASQKSDTSTRGLTSLPLHQPPAWRDRLEWAERCRAAVHAAGSRIRRDDVETGRGG